MQVWETTLLENTRLERLAHSHPRCSVSSETFSAKMSIWKNVNKTHLEEKPTPSDGWREKHTLVSDSAYTSFTPTLSRWSLACGFVSLGLVSCSFLSIIHSCLMHIYERRKERAVSSTGTQHTGVFVVKLCCFFSPFLCLPQIFLSSVWLYVLCYSMSIGAEAHQREQSSSCTEETGLPSPWWELQEAQIAGGIYRALLLEYISCARLYRMLFLCLWENFVRFDSLIWTCNISRFSGYFISIRDT